MRGLVVVVLLLVLAGIYLQMRRGWQHRTERQADVPAPAAAPEHLLARADDGVEATYVSTTSAADWLDRITVHGLGVRSAARVLVDAAGVLVARAGAPDVFVPAAALHGVGRERFRAGKAVTGEGLVVVEWSLGDRLVATAVAPRHDADRDGLVAAVTALIPSTDTSTGTSTGTDESRPQ